MMKTITQFLRVFPLIAVVFALMGCSQRKNTSLRLGDFNVQIAIEPDPPRTGENKVHLVIRDTAGRAVEGAQLTLEYQMPAMGAMPQMKGMGEVSAEGSGRYTIAYPLSMLGDWYLTLNIEAPTHPPASMKLKVSPPRQAFTIENQTEEARPRVAKTLEVSPDRQQRIGVTFASVEERPLRISLRAAGHVEIDERKLADITLKYEAYVEKLFLSETGRAVKEGQPLLRLYSPDLLAAQEELLTARKAGAGSEIVGATERRLTYWGLNREQIADLERRSKADGRVTIYSPATGIVLEKAVVEGAHVLPGTTLYRIGNLGRIWVQAAMYERDAPLVSVGQTAQVSLPALADQTIEARVTFVAPTVDAKTRTVEARLELLNPKMLLKPGMFADVVVEVALGQRLSVPDSALLLSGQHRYVFVDGGQGRLQAVEVDVGALAGEYVEVRSGLAKGDRVAMGPTFLLSSEAQLRDALPQWKTR